MLVRSSCCRYSHGAVSPLMDLRQHVFDLSLSDGERMARLQDSASITRQFRPQRFIVVERHDGVAYLPGMIRDEHILTLTEIHPLKTERRPHTWEAISHAA